MFLTWPSNTSIFIGLQMYKNININSAVLVYLLYLLITY